MPLISPNMSMSEVVKNHLALIPVINRFNIRLGLGDKSVKVVCEEHALDVDFFLTVINTFLNEDYFPEKKLKSFHLSEIIQYLTRTNQYYSRYQVPNIERHLDSLISMSQAGNSSLEVIRRFFGTFKREFLARIEHDDQVWFPYCLSIAREHETRESCQAEGIHLSPEQEVAEDPIEALLGDLENLIIKHLSGNYNDNLCYAVLFAIGSLEKDVKQHNRIRYIIVETFPAGITHKRPEILKRDGLMIWEKLLNQTFQADRPQDIRNNKRNSFGRIHKPLHDYLVSFSKPATIGVTIR